jgi:hypothetical protein
MSSGDLLERNRSGSRPRTRPSAGTPTRSSPLAATCKAIISYRTGKRTADNTVEFAADLRASILGRPQISSDGFRPYVDAVDWGFRLRGRLRADREGI